MTRVTKFDNDNDGGVVSAHNITQTSSTLRELETTNQRKKRVQEERIEDDDE